MTNKDGIRIWHKEPLNSAAPEKQVSRLRKIARKTGNLTSLEMTKQTSLEMTKQTSLEMTNKDGIRIWH